MSAIPFPKGKTPSDYLHFAVADLGEGSERELINSVSNAKRALHRQVDTISAALGWNGKKDFPPKLKFCKACGVIGPRILERLNILRNHIEHQYVVPTKEQTEDYIDVVELFLAATNGFIIAFPSDVELSPEEFDRGLATNYLQTKWEPFSGKIALEAKLLTISIK